MSVSQSFLGKVFVVSDPDARIRDSQNPINYLQYKAGEALPPGAAVGDFKRIAQNTRVTVSDVRKMQTGSTSITVLALAAAGGLTLGWVSTRNFAGKFINETIGQISPAAGAGQFGPNAAWSHGSYQGQIDLVEIVDNTLEIEHIALRTVQPYLDLVAAAAAVGVTVAINSGFRSYPEQKHLYDGFKKGLPGFNKAAPPGASNHQNGIAFDIAVAGASGSPVYDWLKVNATSFGFVRTVNGEPWHWEYDPPKAAKAKQKGTFKAPGVSN